MTERVVKLDQIKEVGWEYLIIPSSARLGLVPELTVGVSWFMAVWLGLLPPTAPATHLPGVLDLVQQWLI